MSNQSETSISVLVETKSNIAPTKGLSVESCQDTNEGTTGQAQLMLSTLGKTMWGPRAGK